MFLSEVETGCSKMIRYTSCMLSTTVTFTASREALSIRIWQKDLVQETFLIAQKRLDRVTSSENPTGWLINTLKNVIGNTYQKRQFIYTELSPDAIADEAGEYVHSINDMYAGLIDDEALSLLIWIYCEDTSYQEAANRLGISLDSCKKRIQRAKQALKKAIEKNKLL